jgi:hypothetical protein
MKRLGLSQPLPGALFGVGVWGASYLGWLPAVGLIQPAIRHPARRNALMLSVHLVWGLVTALTIQDFDRSRERAFASGPLRDAPEGRR